nr:rRNA adenine N-6-methyltransferase family protein [Devosia ureilytica]
MVENQIQTSSVTDVRLLKAFHGVPRECFVPEGRRELAYSDAHHPLGNGRILPAPSVFARLVQLADIRDTDHVLDVGAASGYSTAIIAAIARKVVGWEPDAALAAAALSTLAELGIANATMVAGDGLAANFNGFDAIIVEGAVKQVPNDLLGRLALGGRLVCLLRQGPTGVATVYTRAPEGVVSKSSFNATLPLMELAPTPEIFVF